MDIPCRTCQNILTPVNAAAGEYRCTVCNKPYQLKNRAPSKALICKECGVSCQRINQDGDLGGAEWFQCTQCSKKYKRTTSFNYAQIEKPRCKLCDNHPAAGSVYCQACLCATVGCGQAVVAGSRWCVDCRCPLCLVNACQSGLGHCGCACQYPGCNAQALAGSSYCTAHRCSMCSGYKAATEAHCQNCGVCRVIGCNNQEAVFAFCITHFCPCCGQREKAAGAAHCGCACQASGCLNPTVADSPYCSIHRCSKCGAGPKDPQAGHCGCFVEKVESKTVRYETVWYPPKHNWTASSWYTKPAQTQVTGQAVNIQQAPLHRTVSALGQGGGAAFVRSMSQPNFAPSQGGEYASAVGLGPAFAGQQYLFGGTMTPNPVMGGHLVTSTHQQVTDGAAGFVKCH